MLVAAAIVVAAGVFVDGNHAPSVERSLFREVNQLPTAWYWPAWAVMQAGNMLVVPAVALPALLTRRYRLMFAALLVGVGKFVGSRLIKEAFARERPAQLLQDIVVRSAPTAGQAFVSGHAAIAVGLATVLHPYLGRKGRIAVWTVAALVCIARVYVGAHLPLDVIGGAAAGWLIGTLANLVVDALGRITAPAKLRRTA